MKVIKKFAIGCVAAVEGVDAELLAKVLNNPEMAELLTSLAKTMK